MWPSSLIVVLRDLPDPFLLETVPLLLCSPITRYTVLLGRPRLLAILFPECPASFSCTIASLLHSIYEWSPSWPLRDPSCLATPLPRAPLSFSTHNRAILSPSRRIKSPIKPRGPTVTPSTRTGLNMAIASLNPAINFVYEDRAKALQECISPDLLTRSRRKLLIWKAREKSFFCIVFALQL